MSPARPDNQAGRSPIALSCLAILVSVCAGCATTGQHAAVDSYSIEAYDPGPSWRMVEGAPKRYVPADLPSDTPLTFRNGGWVDAHGLEFFIPHESRAGESEALIKSLIGPPSAGEQIAEASLITGQIIVWAAWGTVSGLPSM